MGYKGIQIKDGSLYFIPTVRCNDDLRVIRGEFDNKVLSWRVVNLETGALVKDFSADVSDFND